jgi:hypothetical protein
MESELSGNQHQLLRAFNQLAGGSPTTDVTASAAAQEAGFDLDSREFEAALGYLEMRCSGDRSSRLACSTSVS